MFEQDKNLKPAAKDEFLQKVKSYPEGDFIGKVKDLAELKADAAEKPVTRWSALFSDSTYSIFFCLQCSNHFSSLDVFYGT